MNRTQDISCDKSKLHIEVLTTVYYNSDVSQYHELRVVLLTALAPPTND